VDCRLVEKQKFCDLRGEHYDDVPISVLGHNFSIHCLYHHCLWVAVNSSPCQLIRTRLG